MAQENPAKARPQVNISSGTITGVRKNGIASFLGVPFARAPFRENRFKQPQEVEPWSDPLSCESFGPTAPQSPYPGRLGEILATVEIAGENILTANIWAPEGAKDLAVAVWFHGGAFERGSTALDVYDGSTFARDGIVFVSINYRLGSEGFSVLPGAPLNLGLEDAGAGLGWVYREIAAFGGDPNKITIMGESAGGQLVGALLGRPEGRLVAGAIIQSGPMGAQKAAKSRRVTKEVAKRLGVKPTLSNFQKLSPKKLVWARDEQMRGKTILDGVPSFVLTQADSSLPEIPAVAVAEARIPLLIGFNTEEFRLWFAPEALKKVSKFRTWLVRRVLRIPKSMWRELRDRWPQATPGEMLGFLLTEKVFRQPALKAATKRAATKRAATKLSAKKLASTESDASSHGSDAFSHRGPGLKDSRATYVYEFSWATKHQQLGAAHALELGFTFDALASDSAQKMAPEAPQELADRMHSDWVRFIKTGTAPWPEFTGVADVHRYDVR